MEYIEMKEIIEKLADDNYKNFVKAFISFEKSIDDEELLDEAYIKYMKSDMTSLLSDDFDCFVR